MKHDSFPLLMIPGPVDLHQRIYEAMSRPLMGHRTQEFINFYEETTEMLKIFFRQKMKYFYSPVPVHRLWIQPLLI